MLRLGEAATLLLSESTNPSGLVPCGARPVGGSSGVCSSVMCEFIVPIDGILSDRAIRDETPFSKTL